MGITTEGAVSYVGSLWVIGIRYGFAMGLHGSFSVYNDHHTPCGRLSLHRDDQVLSAEPVHGGSLRPRPLVSPACTK